MKTKSANQKLQEKQPLFLSLGLVIALMLVITAFEWKQYLSPTVVLPEPEVEAYVLPPIVSTSQLIPPRPKPMTKKKEEVSVPEKAEAIEEAIAEIDPKIFIETPAIDLTGLPALPDEKTDKIWVRAEKMPSFEGGIAAFYAYIRKNLEYPQKAERNSIQGKVFIAFTIDTDGDLTDIKVLKGIGFGCDEEAVRVLESAPKWNPGKQRGKPVKVSMVLPIMFSLPNRF